MRSIEKDKILRINCPGFGSQSYFSSGYAKTLDEYEVIVINPISALHLFDKDPELLQQIESAEKEGMTSYIAKSDRLITSIAPDLEKRKDELARFLEKGGLLVYFLCPPFVIQGPTESLDNYSWLDALAPDKPTSKGDRHMSAAARGHNVEPTEAGRFSHFASYLSQPTVDWTTIIRAEFLSEGYSMLATVGPNKCVAGSFEVGSNGGRAIFLPAPYRSELDPVLSNCITGWASERPPFLQKETSSHFTEEVSSPACAAATQPEQAEPVAPEEPGYEPVLHIEPTEILQSSEEQPQTHEEPYTAPCAQVEASEEQPHAQEEPYTAPCARVEASEEQPLAQEEPHTAPCAQVEASEEQPLAQEEPYTAPCAQEEFSYSPAESEEIPKSKSSSSNHRKKAHSEAKSKSAIPPMEEPTSMEISKAKELIEKLEEISAQAAPDWCLSYSFSDLNRLHEELNSLNEQLQFTQLKIGEVKGRIAAMEYLKNSLLSADGNELSAACSKVFEKLDYKVMKADGDQSEFWLKDGDETAAIVRVVHTTSQITRSDLAQLAESVITYWGEHESEPKGILVASTWADRPPNERIEPDFTEALAEFAKKKHICLMTTTQLLCIYRDMERNEANKSSLKDNIISTNGKLPGYLLEQESLVAAVT